MRRLDIRMLGHFPAESTISHGARDYRRYVVAAWFEGERLVYDVSFFVPTNNVARAFLSGREAVQFEVTKYRAQSGLSMYQWSESMLAPDRAPPLVVKPAAFVMQWIQQNAESLQHWTAFFRNYHK